MQGIILKCNMRRVSCPCNIVTYIKEKPRKRPAQSSNHHNHIIIKQLNVILKQNTICARHDYISIRGG